MIEVTMYQCEICHKNYQYPEEALKCEAQGKDKLGLKINDFVFEHGIHKAKIVKIEDGGHYNFYVIQFQDGTETCLMSYELNENYTWNRKNGGD